MKFRCLIVDDEQLARELIEMYCNKTPGLEVVGLCKKHSRSHGSDEQREN